MPLKHCTVASNLIVKSHQCSYVRCADMSEVWEQGKHHPVKGKIRRNVAWLCGWLEGWQGSETKSQDRRMKENDSNKK
jgi:hypothetical protein